MKSKKLLSLLLCAVMLLGMVPATAHAAPDVTQDAFGRLSDDCWVCEWTTTVLGGNIYSYLAALGAEGYPMELFVDGVLMETLTGSAYTNYNSSYDSKALKTIYSGSEDDFGYSGRGVSTGLYVVKGATSAESCVRIVVINTYLAYVPYDYNANDGTLSLSIYENSGSQTCFRSASSSVVSADLSGFKAGIWAVVTMTCPGTANTTVRSVKTALRMKYTNVDAYTLSGDRVSSLTVNGEKYLISKKAFYDPAVLVLYNHGIETGKDRTYDIWLDECGNILGIREHSGYVFVTVAGLTQDLYGGENVADVIWMNGRTSRIHFRLGENASDDAVKALNGNNDEFGFCPDGTVGNSQVNAWFRYSVCDNWDIVLEDIVPVKGASVRQYAEMITPGHLGNSAPDISPSYSSLYSRSFDGTTASSAYGNDQTRYITVNVGLFDVGGNGIIYSSTGMSIGIRNTNICLSNVNTLSGFKSSTAHRMITGWTGATNDASNTFYLYNDSGYLLAVVAVGSNSSVSKNFIFVISGPTSRQYNGRYLDVYSAIKDNKIETVYVDTAKSGTTDVTKKLGNHRLHTVVYDKDGIVVSILNEDKWGNWTSEGLLPRGSSALDTSANAAAGYSFAYVEGDGSGKNENVVLDGNTLAVNPNSDNVCYLLTKTGDCTFFVYNPDTCDYDIFTTAKSALAAATKKVGSNQCCITAVTSIINSTNGMSRTVIFDTAYDSGVKVLNTVPGNYSAAQFYSTEGETILYSQAISALVSKMENDGATDIELSSVDGIPTVTFSWNGLKMNQRINSLANYNVKQSHKWTFGSKSGYLAAGETLSANVGYSGAAVILGENTLVYAGALNGFNNGLMPSYDITIVEGTDSGNALENALVLLKSVVIENALSVGAFTVPGGTALAVEDALTVTGTLTVVGDIESCADIDAGDNVIIVSGGAVYLEENTLRFGKLIALDKAKVVAHKAVGSSIHAGGDLFFDKLDVQRIAFPGDEKNCCVEVEAGLESVPDVFFGVMGSYEGYLILPEDGSSSLGTVLVLSDGTLCNAGAIKNADGNVGSTLSFNNKGDVVTSIEEVNGGFDLQTTLGNLSIDTACDSALKADVDKSTGALTARVTVSEGENALLIAACYDLSGRQVSVDVIPVEGSASAETVNTGTYCDLYHTYRLMLVDRSTFAPLYASRAIEL